MVQVNLDFKVDPQLAASLLGTSLQELLQNRAKLVEQTKQAQAAVETGLQHLDKFDAMIALIQLTLTDSQLLEDTAAQIGANVAAASQQAESPPQSDAPAPGAADSGDSAGASDASASAAEGTTAEREGHDANGSPTAELPAGESAGS